MQRGDVAVPDGLPPAGVLADALDGQIDFDEALRVGSHNDSPSKSSSLSGMLAKIRSFLSHDAKGFRHDSKIELRN
jgi:hypothetical protein